MERFITQFLLLWAIIICLSFSITPIVACSDDSVSVSVSVDLADAPIPSNRHHLARQDTATADGGKLATIESDGEDVADSAVLEIIEPGPLATPMPTRPQFSQDQQSDDGNLPDIQPGPINTDFPSIIPGPIDTPSTPVEIQPEIQPQPAPVEEPAQDPISPPEPSPVPEPAPAPRPVRQPRRPVRESPSSDQSPPAAPEDNSPSDSPSSSPPPSDESSAPAAFDRVVPTQSSPRSRFRPRGPSSSSPSFSSDTGAVPPRGSGVNAGGISHSGCQGGAQSTISVSVTDWSGRRSTKRLTVHRVLASEVQTIFNEIAGSGFRIKSVGGYNCRGNTSNRAKLSNHAFGVAVDINPDENPYIGRGGVVGNRSFGNRGAVAGRPGVITPSGPVVAAFRKHGWDWGGSWRSVKDYMHFEKPH